MSRKRTVIPEVIDDIELLTEMRNKSYTNLEQEGFKRKELSKALDDMAFYSEAMSAIRKPKEKKNKYGCVGMDDLIKIVAKLNQDVKQIKDTQNVVSANEWIKRHGFSDSNEARGKDLDGDGKPEVFVQTKTSKKPVIWIQFALIPAMVYVYGQDVLHLDESQWKNLRGKRAVKESIEHIVYEYLVDPVKIADFVPTVCKMYNKADLPVEQQHIPLVAKATIAKIVKGIYELPIDICTFEEWHAQSVKQLTQALEKEPTIEEPEEYIFNNS